MIFYDALLEEYSPLLSIYPFADDEIDCTTLCQVRLGEKEYITPLLASEYGIALNVEKVKKFIPWINVSKVRKEEGWISISLKDGVILNLHITKHEKTEKHNDFTKRIRKFGECMIHLWENHKDFSLKAINEFKNMCKDCYLDNSVQAKYCKNCGSLL